MAKKVLERIGFVWILSHFRPFWNGITNESSIILPMISENKKEDTQIEAKKLKACEKMHVSLAILA